MSRKALLWVSLVAILLAGTYYLVVYGSRREADREAAVAASTHTAGPKGGKASYLFLRACGVAATRRETPWRDDLPAHGMLVIPEPRHRPTWPEVNALRRWVDRGGTAVFIAQEPWTYWAVGGKRAFGSSAVTRFRPLIPGGLAAGASYLYLSSPARLKGPFDRMERGQTSPPVIVAGDRFGAAVLLIPHGRGRVILVSDQRFLANERLKSAPDNAVFLLSLVRAFGLREVQFDEYHLGFGYQRTAPRLANPAQIPRTLSLIWWQLVFLGMLYFCTVGRRFGPVTALPETGGRTIMEYVSSMAVLYQRARAGTVALDHLYHGLLERMRLLTGLSSSAGLEMLAKTTASRLGTDPRDLSRLLSGCRTALAGERIPPAELLALAKRIDYYRKELEKWVTSPK